MTILSVMSDDTGLPGSKLDGFVVHHPLSWRRTLKYASSLRIFAPCLWCFLRSHPQINLFM